jgi:hypothetical protein
MAYFMFVDESGHDHRASPYEVLAGVAIHDIVLWDLICAIQGAEQRHFGKSYTEGHERELKAKKLLNRKAFRLAGQAPESSLPQRAALAALALTDGAHASRDALTALGQAKVAFAGEVLDLAYQHQARAFASIVRPDAPRPEGADFLRKDYSYLFERSFHFVDGSASHERGAVVFDEIERSQSHVLLGQMSQYFLRTAKGRERSRRILPEPFFVHSDLTTGIVLADLVAYIVSFNVRLPVMTAPRRPELDVLGEKVRRLRANPVKSGGQQVWAFTVIDDLRTREQRGLPWPP